MIVTMKKVTVICLAGEKAAAVQMMQKLGTLHAAIEQQPVTPDLDAARRSLENLDRALLALQNHGNATAQKPDLKPADALSQVTDILARRQTLAADLDAARRDLALLEPWGSFSADALDSLRSRGLAVELCVTTPAALEKLQLPPGAALKVISGDQTRVHVAVVADHPLTDLALTRAQLPDCTSIPELQRRLADGQRQLDDDSHTLDQLAPLHDDIAALRPQLEDQLQFAATRDAMAESGTLAYLVGYIPERKLDGLLAAARRSGWAIRHEDIQPDDRSVPTLLDIPRRFAIAQAIFDFVGILPGYFETDVSVSMLLFLSLFCGMLIGDAGYGLILTAVTLLGLRKASGDAARNGLKVLLCMSLCTLAFGALSGNWFGIPPSRMPAPLAGLPWLSADTTQSHIKFLCFFIGAAHLSVAHIWNAIRLRASVRDILGNIGWTLFIWANFFAASQLIADGIPHTQTLMYALYGVGAVLIILFSINWHDLGDVIYSPFSFINSFVDILSYIRLFAVGLSGVYIANSFNGMVASIWDTSIWLAPAAIVVLLLGHLLNIAMAALSILVHGVRLNTLEFSGHIGLTWSGRPYRPLRRTADEA